MGTTDLHGPVSADEARLIRCPKCGAGARDLCRRVYRVTPGASPESLDRTNARAGETFETVHEERRRAALRARLRARDQEVLAARPVASRDPTLLRALQDYDRREHDQLRAWLVEHVHLIVGAAHTAPVCHSSIG